MAANSKSLFRVCVYVRVCVCVHVRAPEQSSCTLVEVGEAALGLLAPGFFFLILIPGTGAELRASRKPVDSMAAGDNHTAVNGRVHPSEGGGAWTHAVLG